MKDSFQNACMSCVSTILSRSSHFYIMRYTALAIGLLPLLVKGTNIVLSNDDGWAEINIRAFYNALASGGDSVVISAPAENESGTGTPNMSQHGQV